MVESNNIILKILEAEQFLKKIYLTTVPKDTKKLILFFFPPLNGVTGGLISILNIAKDSRELMSKDGYFIQTCYYPNQLGFFKYRFCDNDESIITFDEAIDNFPEVEDIIIHVPEYYSAVIFKQLTEKQTLFLKKAKKLRINILNQNIEVMPQPSYLSYLRIFSDNISQTTGHKKYTTQEVCNKWGYPLYSLPVVIPTKYNFKVYIEKQDIICFSKDINPYKQEIIEKINKKLPHYELIEINNMSYDKYKELIGNAKYCITFGEGFDGYFSEPIVSGSMSFAVYNEEFFPSAEYKKYRNVYSSYDEMLNKICEDIRYFDNNIYEYQSLGGELIAMLCKENVVEEHVSDLEKFYYEKPLFIPSTATVV